MRRGAIIFLATGTWVANSSAQILFDTFENDGEGDISGWQSLLHPAVLVADAPAGGGDWCIGLNPDVGLLWYDNVATRSFVCPYDPDGYVLSFWTRTQPGDGGFQSVAVGWYDHIGGTNYTFSLDSTGQWTYTERWFPETVVNDSVTLKLCPGVTDVFSPDHLHLFDQIRVDPASSTGVPEGSNRQLPHRPDPVMDRLFVDLAEIPAAIAVFDAQGRMHAITSWRRNDRTLEVDLAHLPAGPCAMLIRIAQGTHVVRFIKA